MNDQWPAMNIRCITLLIVAMSHMCSTATMCMQDVFRLYAFALVLQLCIFIVYITAGQPFRPSSGTVMRQLANAAVHAAPPGLPACWLVAGAASRRSVTLLFVAAAALIGAS